MSGVTSGAATNDVVSLLRDAATRAEQRNRNLEATERTRILHEEQQRIRREKFEKPASVLEQELAIPVQIQPFPFPIIDTVGEVVPSSSAPSTGTTTTFPIRSALVLGGGLILLFIILKKI